MNIAKRLDGILKAPPLTLPLSGPSVFFSDLHMGGGGPADNFAPNEEIFLRALGHYIKEGFFIILVGDIQELWQFDRNEINKAHHQVKFLINTQRANEKAIYVEGNHDRGLVLPEAVLLTREEGPVLVVHGHQGDWINDRYWKLGRFFTRWVWKPLEMAGIHDPTSASKSVRRHDLVRRQLSDWANSLKITLICGHIHTTENDSYYWNIGSGVTSGRVECIEWDEEFKLRTWT